MTALEEQVRAGLHQVDALAARWPHPRAWKWHGPDVTVFGPQQPERDAAEAWGITGTCRTHAVEWGGHGQRCWCCSDNLPAVTR